MKKLLISATISSILLATGCTEQVSTMNKTATTQTDSVKAEQEPFIYGKFTDLRRAAI